MANQIGVNMVSITGKITKPRYYPEKGKWVFTLISTTGRYFVECTQAEVEPLIAPGNQVMITGSLFSRRTHDGYDSASISVREIVLLAQA